MYRPSVNDVEDPAEAVAMVRGRGFGHLVTAGAGGLDAVPLPVLIDDDGLVLRAHVARANPIWRAAPCPALVIVAPVDAYVSPNWYPSKARDPKVVPTWNYELVHVHGTVRVRHEPSWLRSVVGELTVRHEADLPAPWSVDDAPSEFIDKMLRAIVGIEMTVTKLEAKRKLSQNRNTADVEGVIAALDARGPRAEAMAGAMRAATAARGRPGVSTPSARVSVSNGVVDVPGARRADAAP